MVHGRWVVVERLQLTGANRHRAPDALSNLSAVLIDGEDIRIDNGAIHGKAYVERGIRFVGDPEDVPNPRRIAVVWVTLRRAVPGLGVNGLGASVMQIDADAGVGYKHLADQVNKMDGAVRGKIMLESLTQTEHRLLGAFLMAQRAELWENATEAVWAEWLTPEQYAPMKEKMDDALRHREELRIQAEAEAKQDLAPPSNGGLRPRYADREAGEGEA